ncbi:MAG: YARHG domain-containing protein [Lachnospiraceae bacterium]|nr:YARHG domain-containing protein [Lachnospiraceae bacterium]
MREKTLNKIIIGLAVAILIMILLFVIGFIQEGKNSEQNISTKSTTEDVSKTATTVNEGDSDKVTDDEKEETSGKLQDEETTTTTEKVSTEKIEYDKKDDYVLPYSASKYYTKSELSGLTKNQLAIARNEIYAKHGYIFQKNKTMKAYFEDKDWYHGNNSSMSSVESEFNRYEKKNIETIQSLE